MESKISISFIASILVLGLFSVGLYFDDAEAKTTIHEEKYVINSVFVRSDNFSSEEYVTLSLSSIPNDDSVVQLGYTYSNYITGERSQGYGIFEKDLIFTGNLKKKFSVELNTADLDGFSRQIGNNGIISIESTKNGNDFTEKGKEKSESCHTDQNTGIQTCQKQEETYVQISSTVSGTIFGVDVESGSFTKERYSEKIWSNP